MTSLPSRECGLKSDGVWLCLCLVWSLPSRECGLKSWAWNPMNPVAESLPSRECGLKFHLFHQFQKLRPVTPFAGVWIEIFQNSLQNQFHVVTPFAGVWIEIVLSKERYFVRLCHSLRGSVDWNTGVQQNGYQTITSLPSRECGLKYSYIYWSIWEDESLPSRECGLKLLPELPGDNESGVTPFAGVWIEIYLSAQLSHPHYVTPFAGVWIEISVRLSVSSNSTSLPSRECGLKCLGFGNAMSL